MATQSIFRRDEIGANKPLEPVMDEIEFKLPADFHTKKIVALVPAYNEERFIGSVVIKTLRHADIVIVIDDGSSDGTKDIAEAAGAEVIRHEHNQGKGVALNTGFRRARELNPDVVVMIDGDGQHRPDELPLIVAPILAGLADIVVGSRYVHSGAEVPRHRVWGHFVFNFVSNSVSGVPVTDSQSGYRAFSPRAISTLDFNSNGFSVESEIQLLAREHALRLKEVAVTIKYLDKPKRSVITHGMMVLTGMITLVGLYRPLLFFGLPGALLQILGVIWGLSVIEIYLRTGMLPVGYTIISGLFMTLGAMALFTGIILHTMRGLLLSIVRPPKGV